MRDRISKIEHIFERGSGQLNEDSLTCSGNLFAVFDGSSSLVPGLYQGKTGAWWASRLASSEFAKNDASLFELGSRANKRLQLQMTAMGVDNDDLLQRWSTSAVACRLEGDSIEWFQSGDCQILALCDDGGCKLLTRYHNHDQATLEQMKQLGAQQAAEPKKQIRPLVEKVRREMNRSYGVLNGEQAALDFFQFGSRSVKGIRHLLLFTDGLFPPGENPSEQPDFCWLAKHYRQGGLEKVKQEVRRREKADPECNRYPRFKQHDDIAALAISFRD
jgi:serine/threonine protein phosphatase PrpC